MSNLRLYNLHLVLSIANAKADVSAVGYVVVGFCALDVGSSTLTVVIL
jgi:hypothetical protein